MLLDFIQGELVQKGANYVVVKTGGIGFRIFVPGSTLEVLRTGEKEMTLFTYLHVREDELSLFGFATGEEKEIFTVLLSVSGIGPKLALAILSGLKSQDLKRAIVLGDAAILTNISGVGKKTAQRIILELKDKLSKDTQVISAGDISSSGLAKDARGEAISAMVALGYTLLEAQKAVPLPGPEDENVTSEDLIRAALKNLV